MARCFICVEAQAYDEHHIIMQHSGGAAGPTVMLCPNCHDILHRSVKASQSNKSFDQFLALLQEDSSIRMKNLINVALVSSANYDKVNPNPLLSVKLDSPKYMQALHLYKMDKGFTSIDRVVNAILANLAKHYNL